MITTPVKLWRRQKDTAAVIGKTGVILQWTIVRTPPRAFVQEAPYPIVVVRLENVKPRTANNNVRSGSSEQNDGVRGKKMIGQLVDYEEKDLVKGRKVVAILRKLFPENPESVIAYIIKFKPM